MGNLLGNPGQLNQLFDKNPSNTDFFFNSNAANQNLPFDPNLLYGFSNAMNNPAAAQQGPNQADPLNQNNLYLANNNLLFPNTLGFNAMYEDIAKNPNAADYLYANPLSLNDKNILAQGVLGENPNLFGRSYNSLLMSKITNFSSKDWMK